MSVEQSAQHLHVHIIPVHQPCLLSGTLKLVMSLQLAQWLCIAVQHVQSEQ